MTKSGKGRKAGSGSATTAVPFTPANVMTAESQPTITGVRNAGPVSAAILRVPILMWIRNLTQFLFLAIRRFKMTRAECLHTAEEIVTKDRNSQYGEPEDCFALIARLWTDYTAVNLSSADVAAMMILLKVARVRNGKAKDDSWVDMAGYAACGAECSMWDTGKEG